MNKIKTIFTVVAAILCVPLVIAQEPLREAPPVAVITQPIQVGGTVAEFGDGTIAIRSEPSGAPVLYRISNTTQWVDEAGNVVTRETVRAGLPVTLYYTKAENGSIVSKVMVKAAMTPPAARVQETVTTTTVTPAVPPAEILIEVTGKISHFGEGFVAMRDETTAEPVQYLFTDVTKWMDETGKDVTRESVRAGVSATLSYTKSAQGLIARKVVVRRVPAPVSVETTETEIIRSPAPVVQERTTIVEEKGTPKVTERRKTAVVKKPVKKRVQKVTPKPIQRREVEIVEKPVPVETKKTTTTTTTTTQERKKDEDDD